MLAKPMQNFVKEEKDPRILSLLRHYQYEHRVFQQKERECYYSKRMLAQKEPAKYLSLICDGMQQATCAVPSKVCTSPPYRSRTGLIGVTWPGCDVVVQIKFEHGKKKLEQKLIGVIVHGLV